MYFRSCCRSCAILAPRGSPKCSKTARRLDFLAFSTILGTILDRFLLIFHLHLNRISKSISPSMFDFLVQFLMSLSSSSLKFWHGGGLARAAHWMRKLTREGVQNGPRNGGKSTPKARKLKKIRLWGWSWSRFGTLSAPSTL